MRLAFGLLKAQTWVKSGYTVTLAPGLNNTVLMPAPAGCTQTGTNYYATAMPLSTSTGSRSFATDEQGTIWQNNAAPPIVMPQPFTVGANTTPIQ